MSVCSVNLASRLGSLTSRQANLTVCSVNLTVRLGSLAIWEVNLTSR